MLFPGSFLVFSSVSPGIHPPLLCSNAEWLAVISEIKQKKCHSHLKIWKGANTRSQIQEVVSIYLWVFSAEESLLTTNVLTTTSMQYRCYTKSEIPVEEITFPCFVQTFISVRMLRRSWVMQSPTILPLCWKWNSLHHRSSEHMEGEINNMANFALKNVQHS